MTAEKTYLRPQTLADAIKAAYTHRHNFKYIAGGTDVLVNRFQGNETSGCLIDLTDISELRTVANADGCIRIGSLVRLDELAKYPAITEHFPSLVVAAREVASPVIRKTATIGGNILCENRCMFYNQSEWWREAVGYCLKCDGEICIATGGRKACFSKFVSDTAPVLISLHAEVEVFDMAGINTVKLERIYTGDGIRPRNLEDTSIIKSVVLPVDQMYTVVFRKLRPRNAVDFTSLTTAVSLSKRGEIRVVVGGVDPGPIVVDATLNDRHDEIIRLALKKARVVDNDYYSRQYRRQMIEVFIADSLNALLNEK